MGGGTWSSSCVNTSEYTATAWKPIPGKDVLMTGIQSPAAALFLQFNERGGLDTPPPPAKDGAAEPSGEPESEQASSPL